MYIAHSNIDTKAAEAPNEVKATKRTRPSRSEFAKQMSYKLYKKACKKYAKEIAEIQETIPGWMPRFNSK